VRATDRLLIKRRQIMNRKPTLAEPPSKQRQNPEIADRGTLRHGDACITAEFPPYTPRRPKPPRTDRDDDVNPD
jgi:hypothetical protein